MKLLLTHYPNPDFELFEVASFFIEKLNSIQVLYVIEKNYLYVCSIFQCFSKMLTSLAFQKKISEKNFKIPFS